MYEAAARRRGAWAGVYYILLFFALYGDIFLREGGGGGGVACYETIYISSNNKILVCKGKFYFKTAAIDVKKGGCSSKFRVIYYPAREHEAVKVYNKPRVYIIAACSSIWPMNLAAIDRYGGTQVMCTKSYSVDIIIQFKFIALTDAGTGRRGCRIGIALKLTCNKNEQFNN